MVFGLMSLEWKMWANFYERRIFVSSGNKSQSRFESKYMFESKQVLMPWETLLNSSPVGPGDLTAGFLLQERAPISARYSGRSSLR